MLCKIPRQIEIIQPYQPCYVRVTSGSGNNNYCYCNVGVLLLETGDEYRIDKNESRDITFGVYGYSNIYYGQVVINGTQVLKVTNKTTQTYTYTIPEGITAVNMTMTYTSTSTRRNGRITVTTS